MLNINSISCTARLTREPETKYTQAGKAICNFGIAIPNPFQKDGQWKDAPVFIDVETFDKTAERCAELGKGQPVYIEGKLKMDSWEQDGQKRTKLRITAMSVKPFQDGKKGDSSPSESVQEPRASDGLNFDNGDGSDEIGF